MEEEVLTSSPIRDNLSAAYLLYFLLGISCLLPWNTFIAAIDYFGLLYPWGNVNRVFAMAFNFTSVISALLLTFLGQKISAAWRVNTGFVVSVAMLALVPAMGSIFISSDGGTVATYAITVTALALCGFTYSVMYSSMVASASLYLPQRYLQALAAGSGASGLLSCVLRIITKAVMPQTEYGTVVSAYLYFTFSVVIMIASFISYNLEDHLPLIFYYKHLKLSKAPETKHLLYGRVEYGNGLDKYDSLHRVENGNGLDKYDSLHRDDTLPPKEYIDGKLRPQENLSTHHGIQFYKHVWSHIYGYALSLGFLYLVTLSIFPGHVTEDLTSSYFGDWYAILLLTCCYGFEVIGRMLPRFSIFMTNNKAFVIGGSIARVAFYPLYYLCLHGPAVFRLEVVVFVITSIFGLTSGYLNSVLLMLGPKFVPPYEAETAGYLMVTLLQVGLAGGSILQWIWVL